MNDKRIKEPCPFCGNTAKNIQIQHFKDGINKIKCPNCNVTFEGAYSKQEIIDKWNGRYLWENGNCENGCQYCEYKTRSDEDEPCVICSHNYSNKFKDDGTRK